MNDLYRKLVDLYAGRELPAELEAELEERAKDEPELAYDMRSLRATVDNLRASDDVEMTEESYQRILMRLYTRGVDVQPQAPAPAHLQYYLPIQG
ncbi:MAG TPA: hypothetical protein VNL92_05380 [Dehalococcoidia bacterium]|nr:hypothetical protein [Dehalococcoidia bacterium]